jgi:hypothetical protein
MQVPWCSIVRRFNCLYKPLLLKDRNIKENWFIRIHYFRGYVSWRYQKVCLDYMASDSIMTDVWQFGKDLEGGGCGLIEVLAWRGWAKTRKASIRIACAPAEIRTQQLPNKIPERNRYINLFGHFLSIHARWPIILEQRGVGVKAS